MINLQFLGVVSLDWVDDNWLPILWTQLWQVTLAVLIVGLISLRWGRRFPHLVYILWMLVIVKTVVPPVWSSPASMFSWLDTAAAQWQHQPIEFGNASEQFAELHTKDSIRKLASSEYGSTSDFAARGIGLDGIKSEELLTQGRWDHRLTFEALLAMFSDMRVLFGIWASGALLLILGAALQWVRFCQSLGRQSEPTPPWLEKMLIDVRAQLGMRRPVRVRLNSNGIGPLVYGWLRPTLVLPVELLEDGRKSRLQNVLAHELLHARRGDTIFGMVQFVSQVIWWFHPLVWWAHREAHRLCEQCCDEQVIASLRCRPEEYAHSLLDVLELRQRLRAIPACPAVRSVQVTASRLKSLLDRTRSFRQRGPRWQWAVLFAVGLLILPGARHMTRWDEPRGDGIVDNQAMQHRLMLREAASQAFERGEWETAAEKYERLLSIVPNDAKAWFHLGYARHSLGQWNKALEAHREAARYPQTRPIATYNWACVLAVLGDDEAALEKLEEAIEVGFRSQLPIQNDPDLEPLLERPVFHQLASRSLPADRGPKATQLDFWIGEWEVYDMSKSFVGTSVITRDPEDNVFLEKFKGDSKPSGTGVSFYDAEEGVWKQAWVGSTGESTHYSGEYLDGKLRLMSQVSLHEDQELWRRITVAPLPNQSVRQTIETSLDRGMTWETQFDGIYERRLEFTFNKPESDQRHM